MRAPGPITLRPVVAESVTATFSTVTFGPLTLRVPSSGSEVAYRRIPIPRRVDLPARRTRACPGVLARTSWPRGSLPR
jgi:hypothetical protein